MITYTCDRCLETILPQEYQNYKIVAEMDDRIEKRIFLCSRCSRDVIEYASNLHFSQKL